MAQNIPLKSIPFRPERKVDEWEYHFHVASLHVNFKTNWQLFSAAQATFQQLQKAFPDAKVYVFERKVVRIYEVELEV